MPSKTKTVCDSRRSLHSMVCLLTVGTLTFITAFTSTRTAVSGSGSALLMLLYEPTISTSESSLSLSDSELRVMTSSIWSHSFNLVRDPKTRPRSSSYAKLKSASWLKHDPKQAYGCRHSAKETRATPHRVL